MATCGILLNFGVFVPHSFVYLAKLLLLLKERSLKENPDAPQMI